MFRDTESGFPTDIIPDGKIVIQTPDLSLGALARRYNICGLEENVGTSIDSHGRYLIVEKRPGDKVKDEEPISLKNFMVLAATLKKESGKYPGEDGSFVKCNATKKNSYLCRFSKDGNIIVLKGEYRENPKIHKLYEKKIEENC
jgi:hypothetical protein